MGEIIARISTLVEEKQDFIHLTKTTTNMTDVIELPSVTHTPMQTPQQTPNMSPNSSRKEIKLQIMESSDVLNNRDSWLYHFKTLGTKLYLITDHHTQNSAIYHDFVEALKIRKDMLLHFQELVRKQQSRFRTISNQKSILLKKIDDNLTNLSTEDDIAVKQLEFELDLIQHIIESEYRLLMEYTGYITYIFQSFIRSMVNYTHQTYLLWNDLSDNLREWPSDHLI